MNWPRIILDGIAMSAVFNAVVLVGFTLWPQEYSVMFPKEIKGAVRCKAWERKENGLLISRDWRK